jgi:type II secretory pathway pseudopilin PulG
MLTRIRQRLAGERGFTIVEVLIGCVLTLIVTSSAMAVLDGAYRHNNDIQRRAESQQIARTAVDEMVRRLRNEVCLDVKTTPVVTASGTSVTFYADFGTGAPTSYPERHVLSLNTGTGTLTDTWSTTSTGKAADYVAAGTRVIARGVSQVGSTPLMTFYAYDTSSPPAPNRQLNSGTNSVAAADLPKIARIVVNVQATAPGATPVKDAAQAKDEAFVRLVDPTDSAPAPRCS